MVSAGVPCADSPGGDVELWSIAVEVAGVCHGDAVTDRGGCAVGRRRAPWQCRCRLPKPAAVAPTAAAPCWRRPVARICRAWVSLILRCSHRLSSRHPSAAKHASCPRFAPAAQSRPTSPHFLREVGSLRRDDCRTVDEASAKIENRKALSPWPAAFSSAARVRSSAGKFVSMRLPAGDAYCWSAIAEARSCDAIVNALVESCLSRSACSTRMIRLEIWLSASCCVRGCSEVSVPFCTGSVPKAGGADSNIAREQAATMGVTLSRRMVKVLPDCTTNSPMQHRNCAGIFRWSSQ